MSRLTAPRRWAVMQRRQGAAPQTEHAITPEEAREALNAAVLQVGCVLERVEDYDPDTDLFHCVGRSHEGHTVYLGFRGERVGQIVAAARAMSGMPKGLLRPSDLVKKK